MKTYTVAALFAAATVCAVAPANAASNQEYLSAVDEILASCNKMTAALNSVHDRASADAAAPTVSSCLRRKLAAMVRLDAMGTPTSAQQAQLRAARPNIEQDLNTAWEKFFQAVQNAVGDESNPCYGSKKLIDALMSIDKIQ